MYLAVSAKPLKGEEKLWLKVLAIDNDIKTSYIKTGKNGKSEYQWV